MSLTKFVSGHQSVTVIDSPITSKQLAKTFELICFATELCLSGCLTDVNENKRQISIITTALSITSVEVKGFQMEANMRLPDDLAKIKYVLFFSNFWAASPCTPLSYF